jgi:hypothetical protein
VFEEDIPQNFHLQEKNDFLKTKHLSFSPQKMKKKRTRRKGEDQIDNRKVRKKRKR